jgi:hypothetical protein
MLFSLSTSSLFGSLDESHLFIGSVFLRILARIKCEMVQRFVSHDQSSGKTHECKPMTNPRANCRFATNLLHFYSKNNSSMQTSHSSSFFSRSTIHRTLISKRNELMDCDKLHGQS